MREIHIQSNRASELVGALPALERNHRCDPARIPPGTTCFLYPRGQEQELESMARNLGIHFEWGSTPSNGTAIAEAAAL